MCKQIIMYRTAIFCQDLSQETLSYSEKASCEELINSFNEGELVVNYEDKQKSYSIVK